MKSMEIIWQKNIIQNYINNMHWQTYQDIRLDKQVADGELKKKLFRGKVRNFVDHLIAKSNLKKFMR